SQREMAVAEHEIAQQMMKQVASSLAQLQDFSSNLKENVTYTSAISREVTAAFMNVASSTERQTTSITDIGESMQNIRETVEVLTERSTNLKTLSEQSRS